MTSVPDNEKQNSLVRTQKIYKFNLLDRNRLRPEHSCRTHILVQHTGRHWEPATSWSAEQVSAASAGITGAVP